MVQEHNFITNTLTPFDFLSNIERGKFTGLGIQLKEALLVHIPTNPYIQSISPETLVHTLLDFTFKSISKTEVKKMSKKEIIKKVMFTDQRMPEWGNPNVTFTPEFDFGVEISMRRIHVSTTFDIKVIFKFSLERDEFEIDNKQESHIKPLDFYTIVSQSIRAVSFDFRPCAHLV